MRIGVNAVPLRVYGGGARFVFTELMEHLLALDRENEYVIFAHFLGLGVVNKLAHTHPHLCHDIPAHRRARVVEVSCEEDIFEHRDHFDLLFGPLNNLQPRIYDRPSVAILHDIQEQYFPQYFSESDLRARHEIYPEICRSATTLVTISEFCKRSIIEKFDIEPGKIEVVYNAPQSGLIAREANDEGTWRQEPLPERFFFYPANCYLHKNHALLLDALAMLKRAGRVPPAVVFTGFELPGGFPLRRQIAERGLQEVCRVFNEVRVDELRYLYRHATAVVLPTLFEGFGMPAVEAMACGCPVICSDLPALREVAGDHALYFKPDQVEQLVDQLERIEQDSALRARLVAAGRDAARRFSWDRSARRMLEILQEAPAHFYSPRTLFNRTTGDRAPKIGVLITATQGGHRVPEAIKEVWRTGYPNVVMRVLFRAGEDNEQTTDFLSHAEIPHQTLSSRQTGLWDPLRQFAEEEKLDLVGELLAGHNSLLPTALHSLAWAYRREPDKAVYLGEAWEEEQGRIARSARLRLLDTGDWKLDEFLYPEMLFVNFHNLAGWNEGKAHVKDAGEQWRWVLLKEAHRAKQLCVIRRTLAICRPSYVSALDRCRAVWSGGSAVHSGNGQPRLRAWLRAVKPLLRPASRVLPQSLRSKGKRVWRHLANEP